MQPKIYSVSDHDIDPALIDRDAVFVMQKLRDAGYTAYLVGGGVRDLLVKRRPKDFDISTSARPEQIKALFNRNCILIGRRFRLAHIRFGHKILEVSTFRSGENDSDLIVHDNEWGSPEEDVLRRDFTINGLFYDPAEHVVIDYVGGWEDIHKGVLRTIGDPANRFKQDPVRMIRLLKFRARFNFEIDVDARKALVKCKEEIVKSSPARILEELLRMLESGASSPFIMLMYEAGMLDLLIPCLHLFLQGKNGHRIYQQLAVVDRMHQSSTHGPLDRGLLCACLIYPIFEEEVRAQYLDKGITPHLGEITLLSSSLIKMVVTTSFSHFPKKISASMGYILAAQYRLTPLTGRRHLRMRWLNDHDFRLALIMLKMRALIDPSLQETYDWWRNTYKQHERPHDPRVHNSHHYKRARQHVPPNTDPQH